MRLSLLLSINILLTILPSFIKSETYYCPTSPNIPVDRRVNKSTLRFIHFNVEWLFIDEYDDCPGSGCPWDNEKEAHYHLNSIANVLNDLNGDIVNLVEVESCDELNELIDTNSLSNMGYLPYM